MNKRRINHLAVLLVVVMGQVIPALWFGYYEEKWMALNGLTADFVRDNQSATPYVASILASFVFAYLIAWMFVRMDIGSAGEGLVVAILMGFAFTHLPGLIHNLFSFRPYELSWINGGADLLVWALAGLILGGWRKMDDNQIKN